jgi:hypothetical protein
MMRLIGIPWGNGTPPKEADCLTLAIYAQKLLWGKDIKVDRNIDWTPDTLRERSYEVEKELSRFAFRVPEAEIGDVAFIETCGYMHLVTFVDVGKILHTILNGKSRISRFRGKEVSIWSLR